MLNSAKRGIFIVDTKGDDFMLTKVQKWGNSLALRIPKAFAVEAMLQNNSFVDMSISKKQIIITPIPTPSWTLDELLAGITNANCHNEIDTGPAVGSETW